MKKIMTLLGFLAICSTSFGAEYHDCTCRVFRDYGLYMKIYGHKVVKENGRFVGVETAVLRSLLFSGNEFSAEAEEKAKSQCEAAGQILISGGVCPQ